MTEAIPPTPNPEAETGHESVPEAVAREMGDRAVGAVCPHCHERIGFTMTVTSPDTSRAKTSLDRLAIVRVSESDISPEEEARAIIEHVMKKSSIYREIRLRSQEAQREQDAKIARVS